MDKSKIKPTEKKVEEAPKKYSSKGVKTKLNKAADKMFFNTKHS